MTDHAPEPWIAKKLVGQNWVDDWVVVYQDGAMQRRIDTNGLMDEQDARRIVACVNACKGIPTDRLEDSENVGTAYLELRKDVAEKHVVIAEAMVALERLLDHGMVCPTADAMAYAHGVLVKLKAVGHD